MGLNIWSRSQTSKISLQKKHYRIEPLQLWFCIWHFCIYIFIWEKIYYLEIENTYPHSKALTGHFLGVVGKVDDALTLVMSSEEGTILTRSVIRFVSEIASFPNLRLKHTQYEGIATRPIFTLMTLNAAPKTDTKKCQYRTRMQTSQARSRHCS